MENASKALIIAGAILLSILIISLGIMIYNNAVGVVNTDAMSEVDIQQFNSKFTQYEGKSVKGATVNSMFDAVLASNRAQNDASRQIVVSFDNGSGASNIITKNGTDLNGEKATTGATYEVKCSRGSNGLVNKITVKKSSGN